MEGGEVTEELAYTATISKEAGEDFDDSDRPCLSSHTLAALQEFFLQNQPSLDATAADSVEETENNGVQADLLPEDWRLSQFWYDPATAQVVAEELHHLSRLTASTVACIACPTLYVQLKKSNPEVEAQIFEFDKRFEKYGTDFIFYDYNQPEDLPSIYQHKFQVVVADPPYLWVEDKTHQGRKIQSTRVREEIIHTWEREVIFRRRRRDQILASSEIEAASLQLSFQGRSVQYDFAEAVQWFSRTAALTLSIGTFSKVCTCWF